MARRKGESFRIISRHSDCQYPRQNGVCGKILSAVVRPSLRLGDVSPSRLGQGASQKSRRSGGFDITVVAGTTCVNLQPAASFTRRGPKGRKLSAARCTLPTPSRKVRALERSLSLLLPVRDAQATLSETVHRILEVASDLTDRFELIIIDDGSTDATSEVAEELKRDYPQIRAVRHGQPRGSQESLQTGLRMCSGRVILCGDAARQLAVDELPRVWKSVATGRIAPPPDGSFRLIDRHTGQQLHGPSRPTRPNFLGHMREFALGE